MKRDEIEKIRAEYPDAVWRSKRHFFVITGPPIQTFRFGPDNKSRYESEVLRFPVATLNASGLRLAPLWLQPAQIQEQVAPDVETWVKFEEEARERRLDRARHQQEEYDRARVVLPFVIEMLSPVVGDVRAHQGGTGAVIITLTVEQAINLAGCALTYNTPNADAVLTALRKMEEK